MTSQELYYLREMANLAQSIGREETLPPLSYLNEPAHSVFHVYAFGPSEKRSALERKAWHQIQHNSRHFLERDAHHVDIYAKHEGFLWFVVLWDHWQLKLEDAICHDPRSSAKLSPAVKEQYLWNDGLNE
jgi:hypothetical protein